MNWQKGFSLGIDLDIYEHLPVVFRGTEQNGYKSFAKTSFSAGDLSEGNPVFPDKEILVVNSYSVFCSGGTG